MQLAGRRATALLRRAVEMMVVKPAAHYEQWFPMAVELVLPILAQLRQAMGVANRHVGREGAGRATELRLPLMDQRARVEARPTAPLFASGSARSTGARAAGAVAHASCRRGGSPLVDYRRPKVEHGVMCWILDQVTSSRSVLGQ